MALIWRKQIDIESSGWLKERNSVWTKWRKDVRNVMMKKCRNVIMKMNILKETLQWKKRYNEKEEQKGWTKRYDERNAIIKTNRNVKKML